MNDDRTCVINGDELMIHCAEMCKMEKCKNGNNVQARKLAEKMKCPLIFSSAAAGVNIKKLFKLVLAKVFDLKPTVPKVTNIGEPIIEY